MVPLLVHFWFHPILCLYYPWPGTTLRWHPPCVARLVLSSGALRWSVVNIQGDTAMRFPSHGNDMPSPFGPLLWELWLTEVTQSFSPTKLTISILWCSSSDLLVIANHLSSPNHPHRTSTPEPQNPRIPKPHNPRNPRPPETPDPQTSKSQKQQRDFGRRILTT